MDTSSQRGAGEPVQPQRRQGSDVRMSEGRKPQGMQQSGQESPAPQMGGTQITDWASI